MMLPVVTEKMLQDLEQDLHADEKVWQKQVLYHLKEENPVLTSLIANLAEGSADPKGVIKTGFLVYKALEMAQHTEEKNLSDLFEQ